MKRIYLSPPHMGSDERALLLDAFDSNWIAPCGPHVDAFEREFAAVVGRSAAVALSSGTAALHLALQVVGVSTGDDVLTSDLTFAATANTITYLGARPVFIDSERASWNMDPDLLAEELETAAGRGRLPRAVVVVDILGNCADYDRILPVCEAHGVPVIEDAAEALGATYHGRPAGSLGRIGAYSFNGNKIITTSGGGMLAADEHRLVDRARYLANQARDAVPFYQHSEVGFNYRMSNLLAAVGRGQLRRLEDRVRQRRAVRDFYRAALGDLPGIELMPEPPWGGSSAWLTCITIDPGRFGSRPEEIRQKLEEQDIESRQVWKPMHLQPAFRGCSCRGGVVAEEVFENGLCLPSGSAMSHEDLERVVGALRSVRG